MSKTLLKIRIMATKQFNHTDWVEYATQRMYGIDDAVIALGYAWQAHRNIILHGPPGYGKSLLAEMMGDYLTENDLIESGVYIRSMTSQTTIEDLYGGIDLLTYRDSGELKYLLQYSFANYEYVILEEFGDAMLEVLASLKDSLTSGFVRLGTTMFQVKTLSICACTNYNRNELIDSLSSAGIFERFPLDVEVKWNSNTFEDYFSMLQRSPLKQHTYECKFVAKAVELAIAARNAIPSPRTAYMAAEDMVTTCSHKILKYYFELGLVVDQVHEQLKVLRRRELSDTMLKMLNEIEEEMTHLDTQSADNYVSAARELLRQITTIMITAHIHEQKLGDEVFEILTKLNELGKSLILTLFTNVPSDASPDPMVKMFRKVTPALVNQFMSAQVRGEDHSLSELIVNVPIYDSIIKIEQELFAL